MKYSYCKVALDAKGSSLCYAWFVSDDKPSLVGLLKLHRMMFAGYRFHIKLMEFLYEHEDTDIEWTEEFEDDKADYII